MFDKLQTRSGFTSWVLSVLVATGALGASGQTAANSLEVSEEDGVPVLVKHLPEWESVKSEALFARSAAELTPSLGERPILDLLDFSGGTEAVVAAYPAGKLLIVEYASPQASAEADREFKKFISNSTETIVYRRIGNYNAVVLDVTDTVAADALLDQIKYEKQIQWLGDNPFRISAERAFVMKTTDIFISTLIAVLIGIGVSLVGGLIAGYLYYRVSDRRRREMTTFTDGGGMVRLNLDGYTPQFPSK